MYPFPRMYYEYDGSGAPPTASRNATSAASRITRSTAAPSNKTAAARAVISSSAASAIVPMQPTHHLFSTILVVSRGCLPA